MDLHQSVLLKQSVTAWLGQASGFYVDGTFGRGGHSRLLLEQLNEDARLLVIDKDPAAVQEAEALAAQDSRVIVRQGSFAGLHDFCDELGVIGSVQGILLDLGVSSPQLDDAQRGFSFTRNGPLDMRMDNTAGQSAEAWVNSAEEQEIARVLYEYGEERFSRRMARAIVAARSEERISTTARLAEIIKAANPAWEKHKHPATRAFQGIRIHINDELKDLSLGLQAAVDVLAPGGRMVVISFHSLEDRLVKRFIQKQAKGDDFPQRLPITADQLKPLLKRVGKPLKATVEELDSNIRSRSAVLRVAERLPTEAGR